MGRSYAGILGPVAMTVVILRGVAGGAAADATLWSAVLALAGLAVVGWMVGFIAESTIEESVRSKMEVELQSAMGDGAST